MARQKKQDTNSYDYLPENDEPIVESVDLSTNIEKAVIIAIESYVSPQRLAILLGLTELELKEKIVDNAELLSVVRNLLFNQQTSLTRTIIHDTLDKKNTTDFLSTTAEKHFDLWSRFIATDYDKASDFILLSSAIKGGIGNNENFWLNATADIKENFKVAMRTNENFLRMFFDVIEGVPFKMGKHHKAMFDELDLLQKGITNILIINLPPRVGKSTTLYAWAAKMLMQKPNSNIIYGSYGEVVLTLIRKRIDMAFTRSKYEDNKINPFYEIYGVGKAKGFDKEADFLTDINSSFFSATLMGGITGRGYSVYADANGAMLIDDPNNPNDVGTARMDTIWEKFITTWNSRRGLNPLCVNMQRVASNDLTANILEQYKDSNLNIRVLTMPLEMTEEVEEYVSKMQGKYPNITFVNPLKYLEMGDTLLPAQSVELIKKSMHPSIYKTQYLQIPTSLEGSIFKSRMFYNKAHSIEPVRNSRGEPIGYVKVNCTHRTITDKDTWEDKPITFDGVFILHIDTTSGNLDTLNDDVDDCVWSICVGGLKRRSTITDNYFGAILQQFSINSKQASDSVMQNKTLEIIDEIKRVYGGNPRIIVAMETHAQGGGLASYLRGLNLYNVVVFSYSRQNFGNKKQRFIQGAGFYEDRLFWVQDDNNIFNIKNIDGVIETTNNWYYKSRIQHLSVDGDNTRIHDDYCEAPTDICNLWIADDKKDIIYQYFEKLNQAKG